MEDFWRSRDEYQCIQAFIKQQFDIYVYGMSGVGKTTFIDVALTDSQVRYIRINGMTCQTKSGLLKSLTQKLDQEFDIKLPESLKMHTFIANMENLMNYTREKGEFEFKVDKFYVLIDNAERMINVSPKYMGSLLQVKHQLGINFSFIFVAGCKDEKIDDYFYMRDFELMPKIMVRKPTVEQYQTILTNYVLEDKIFKNLHGIEKKRDEIIQDVVHTFLHYLHPITQFKMIFRNIFLIMQEDNLLNHPTSLLSTKNYKSIKKYYIDNPHSKVSVQDLSKQLRELSYEEVEINLADFMYNEVKKSEIEIAKIPAIILICCYIGNNNPDKMDRRLFKDYKRKSKPPKVPREKKKEDKREFKPVSFNRLMALTQSLISICFVEFEEIQLFDQSLDFYSQLNMLVQMGYVGKSFLHGNEFEKIKYTCNLDYEAIAGLCKVNDIRIQDFLYQPNS